MIDLLPLSDRVATVRAALKLRLRSTKAAIALLLTMISVVGWRSAKAQYEGNYFYIRPDNLHAYRPFKVVAYSGECESLFTGALYSDFVYDGVTVEGNDIYVRFGAAESFACGFPLREEEQTVGGLPSGNYTIHLIYQHAPPLNVIYEWEVEQMDIAIAGQTVAGVHAVPALDSRLLVLTGVLVLLGASGRLGFGRREH